MPHHQIPGRLSSSAMATVEDQLHATHDYLSLLTEIFQHAAEQREPDAWSKEAMAALASLCRTHRAGLRALLDVLPPQVMSSSTLRRARTLR